MNIILVDPYAKKITCEDLGPKLTLPVAYALIGCDCVAAYKLYNVKHHGFYCDDEALYKKPLPPAFLLDCYPEPVYGRILIFGTDGGKYEVSPTITVEDVFAMVFSLP